MPVIQVWCLPEGISEKDFINLFNDIVSAVVEVRELGLKDMHDMTILFPPDRMRYGLGEDIIIEISKLFDKPERTAEVRNRLAGKVGGVIKKYFPDAYVECFVETFDPQSPKVGFWASNKEDV